MSRSQNQTPYPLRARDGGRKGQHGGNVQLSINPSVAGPYQWLNGGIAIGGATNATYTATATGNYSVAVVIAGKPNTGKSTLLNVLLNDERAIVSEIAGTTRDTIEATANVRGFPVIFIDTAGLRTSDDLVEREGIRRSESAAREAELVLWVLDASEEFSDEDEKRLRTLTSKPTILVLNKSDLNRRCVVPQEMLAIEVSCATGQGMDALKDAIRDQVGSGRLTGELMDVTINARHQNALRRGDEFLSLAEGGLETGLSIELIAIELKSAVGAIGEIVGKTSTEDLLDVIFSQFCLGK